MAVLNLNDNPPVFNETQLTVQLQEELPAGRREIRGVKGAGEGGRKGRKEEGKTLVLMSCPLYSTGTIVATLVVTDEDGDDLTERIFSITSGDEFGNFSFDSTLQ